jgi:hypothetical protein
VQLYSSHKSRLKRTRNITWSLQSSLILQPPKHSQFQDCRSRLPNAALSPQACWTIDEGESDGGREGRGGDGYSAIVQPQIAHRAHSQVLIVLQPKALLKASSVCRNKPQHSRKATCLCRLTNIGGRWFVKILRCHLVQILLMQFNQRLVLLFKARWAQNAHIALILNCHNPVDNGRRAQSEKSK